MPEHSEKRSRGCLFYGCITMIVVIVALITGTYFGTRQALKMLVGGYTDTAPVDVPSLNLTEEQRVERLKQLQQRLDGAMEKEGAIALDETDLNLLLGQTPELGRFSQQIFLKVETNQLKGQVSIPLDQFESWQKVGRRFGNEGLSGRYLNATLTLEPKIENQNLQLNLKNVEVRGKPLPENFTAKIQLQDLADKSNQNSEARAVLDRIENIEVKDGKVHIRFKSPPRPPNVI